MPEAPARFPLDPSLYRHDLEELQFFKKETGIQDDEKLKRHIIDVQRKAYEVFPYMCISKFGFLQCKVAKYTYYKNVLELGKKRPGAIFLDLGCCFGNDIRKTISDGWPMQNTVGSDLRGEFWDLGHELFLDTPESFPVPFITGDIFSNAVLDMNAAPLPALPALERSTLTTLTPLKGHASVIHASSFFHLFDEGTQKELARRIASLLSKEPGSIIFGSSAGEPDGKERVGINPRREQRYLHSPSSWKKLWETEILPGQVEVQAFHSEIEWNWGEEGTAMQVDNPDRQRHNRLTWMVTRL